MSKQSLHTKAETDLSVCNSSFATVEKTAPSHAATQACDGAAALFPKIFIVEDDPLILELLSVKLKHAKCPFAFCSEGTQAVETIRTFAPDVVILDIRVPGKDGFAVLEELRQDSVLKHIPVVIYSNNDSDEDKARARELAVERFCVKATTHLPFFISEVLEVARSGQRAKTKRS